MTKTLLTRKAWRDLAACPVCGHWSAPEGRCGWCGASRERWAFLATIEALPPDTPFVLGCSYGRHVRVGAGYIWVRCPGVVVCAASAFHQTHHVGGNGPNVYPLACRFGMNVRCPECGNCVGDADLLRANREVLLATLATMGRLAEEKGS